MKSYSKLRTHLLLVTLKRVYLRGPQILKNGAWFFGGYIKGCMIVSFLCQTDVDLM